MTIRWEDEDGSSNNPDVLRTEFRERLYGKEATKLLDERDRLEKLLDSKEDLINKGKLVFESIKDDYFQVINTEKDSIDNKLYLALALSKGK